MSDDTEIETEPTEAPAPEPVADLRAELEAQFASEPPPEGAEEPTPEVEEGPRAPVSWTKDAQAEWASLPQSIQAEVLKREGEIQSKLSEDGPYKAIEKALEPYRERLQSAGVSPDQYIGNLLAWNAALAQQPAQAIATLIHNHVRDRGAGQQLAAWVAQQYGYESDALEAPEPPQTDPRVSQLEQRLMEREIADARREWTGFKDAKDAEGRPLHPGAEELKREIAAEIQLEPNLSYAEAYDRARWRSPDHREMLIQEQIQAKTHEARKVASKAGAMDLPRGRSEETTPEASTGDLRKDLTHVLKQFEGR